MLVSHQHRFIFLKTRKTASTSVEIALSALSQDPQDIITPISREDEKTRRRMGLPRPKNYLAPAPEYRSKDLVKLLTKLKAKKRFYNHMPASSVKPLVSEAAWREYKIISIERHPFDRIIRSYYWRTRRSPGQIDINEYIEKCPEPILSNWNIYAIKEEVVASFMLKYEDIKHDMTRLSHYLNLDKPIELPQQTTKGSSRKDRRHWSEVLSEDSKNRIRDACRREANYFNYDLSDPGQ